MKINRKFLKLFFGIFAVVASFVLVFYFFLIDDVESGKDACIATQLQNEINDGQTYEKDGMIYSINPDEIHSANVHSGDIKVLHYPKFVTAEEAQSFVGDEVLGVGIKIDDVVRFYPNSILALHPLVNDCFNGRSVLITFCPLCFTGGAYDRTVNGEVLEFETTGDSWLDNILIQDTKTVSVWSPILGEAIGGEFVQTKLEYINSTSTTFSQWISKYPESEVLSAETGFNYPYEKLKSLDVFDLEREIGEEFVIGFVNEDVEFSYPTSQIGLNSTVVEEIAGNSVEILNTEEGFSVKVNDEEVEDFVITTKSIWRFITKD